MPILQNFLLLSFLLRIRGCYIKRADTSLQNNPITAICFAQQLTS